MTSALTLSNTSLESGRYTPPDLRRRPMVGSIYLKLGRSGSGQRVMWLIESLRWYFNVTVVTTDG